MGTTITSKEELRSVYKAAIPRAVAKVQKKLDRHCLSFVELSPFVVLGTWGEGGADVSPRGGPAGFVKALDASTLLLPDFAGNNRLDSFENIIENGQAALFFLVPGVNETMRVHGTARLDTDPELRAMCEVDGKLPISVVIIKIEEAYLHCAKALMRSGLWDPTRHVDRATLPTFGQMLKDQTGDPRPPESDAEMLRRYKEVLY